MLALKKELASMKKETHAAAGEEKAEDEAAADLHKQVLEPAVAEEKVVAEQKEPAIGTTQLPSLPALEWARLRIVRGALQISRPASTRSFFGN